MCVPIYSYYNNVNLKNDSVILAFEIWTWFLNETDGLDVVDICANLFKNPSMYDKVTVPTQMKWARQKDRRTDGAFILCLP
jgi:hypothetical protein